MNFFAHPPDPFRAIGFPREDARTSHAAAKRGAASARRALCGFSLVEVALALGLFAFVVVPLLGVFGNGLNIGRDAARDSNLAQIYRQAAAKVAANPTNASVAPMYFNYSAVETTESDANAVYKLTFGKVAPTDAAAGLLARSQWKLEVFSPVTSTNSIGQYFVVQNRELTINEFP